MTHMIDIERRALYNLLRMNWLSDDTIPTDQWQVEDYRGLSLNALFEQLQAKGIQLDKKRFIVLSEGHDTPEELNDELAEALPESDAILQDQIYLIVFELWRRLVPEKSSLSIFCDELDHQIYLYDQDQMESAEGIQDAIANLQSILDENADFGTGPLEVFKSVSCGCANEIGTFLYDFIAEEIDDHNTSYAAELLEGFSPYVGETKWFEFLKVRLLASSDEEKANKLLESVIRKTAKEPDLDLNLDILSFMVQEGDEKLFLKVVKNTLSLLNTEEEFQELLATCIDYLRCLDRDQGEQALQRILESRSSKSLDQSVSAKDPGFKEIIKVLKKS